MWEVLETAEYVAKESRLVRISHREITRFASQLIGQDVQKPTWDVKYHYHDGTEKTVAYLLILDTLNYCFWPLPGKMRWEIKYGLETISGYFALAAVLKRAVDLGIPITNADYLAGLSMDELGALLRGNGELQLLERRLQGLNELGTVLLRDYNGKASKLVETAGKSALRLALLLAEKLQSFNDVALYRGHKIVFHKRAQIFVADLHGAFNGENWGRFNDVKDLTAFADYKLPQVLRQEGILIYREPLARKVNGKVFIAPGSIEEVEIRANTIWAVELIRKALKALGKDFKAYEIDWILWTFGQDPRYGSKPYHRTTTIYY